MGFFKYRGIRNSYIIFFQVIILTGIIILCFLMFFNFFNVF